MPLSSFGYTEMKAKTDKLLAWHNVLLHEAMTIAYRVGDERELSKSFLDDLAFSLENLARRVRRELEDE